MQRLFRVDFPPVEDLQRLLSLAVSRARKVILVAEHQKFVNKSYYRICPLDKISMFITDKALTPEQRAMFTDKTEIIVAN